jgi:hypothetical protein
MHSRRYNVRAAERKLSLVAWQKHQLNCSHKRPPDVHWRNLQPGPALGCTRLGILNHNIRVPRSHY